VALNQATLPRLMVNRSYYVEMRRGCDDKTGKGWLSEKLADANWLVKALDQRQKTILKVASEIVTQQDGFSATGSASCAPDPAHRGRGGVAARIDRQPRDLEQISALRARHV
jgi:RNA polymerase sigma-54 factor